jgi:hypothetical protein
LFSDFDLGSPFSEELPPEEEETRPEIKSEFKLPNLEDFELRSKTPKKIHLPHKPQTLHQSRSEVPNKPSQSKLADRSSTSVVLVETLPTSNRFLSPEQPAKDNDDSTVDSPVVVQRKLSNKIALKFDSSSEDEDFEQIILEEEDEEEVMARIRSV